MVGKDILLMKLYYRDIIGNLGCFLQNNGFYNDATDINIIVKYMILHGYLTNNPVHTSILPNDVTDVEQRYFNLANCGILLPYGLSSCRHIANFMFALYNNLGYLNSEVFVYVPQIEISVFTSGKEISDASVQENIDKILREINLFSTEDLAFVKEIDSIVYYFLYTGKPSNVILTGDHALNIVIDRSNKAHIFDTLSNKVGKKSGELCLLYVGDGEYNYRWEYVRTFYNDTPKYTKNKFCKTLDLLYDYEASPMETDLKRVKELEQECANMESLFKEFQMRNSKYYDRISDGTLKLVRKLNESK